MCASVYNEQAATTQSIIFIIFDENAKKESEIIRWFECKISEKESIWQWAGEEEASAMGAWNEWIFSSHSHIVLIYEIFNFYVPKHTKNKDHLFIQYARTRSYRYICMYDAKACGKQRYKRASSI